MGGKREASETYPDNSALESASWRLVLDSHDPYDTSATGSLTVEGMSGVLVVRARYRADDDRLGKDVIREEIGFWTGGDDPDSGDVPFETEVTEWKEDAVGETDD